MTTIDNSKAILDGVFSDATVTVPANTTYNAYTVLGRNASGKLTAFSTNNNVDAVAAAKATGELTFTGTAETSVPIVTKVKTAGNIVFETLETAAIPTGETTITIPARAVEAGADGNIAASTTLSLVAAISGISAVANGAKFSGGADAVAQFIAEPSYILAHSIENSTDSSVDYPLARVLECGDVDMAKAVFVKTADATDENVLTALKNNGIRLVHVDYATA